MHRLGTVSLLPRCPLFLPRNSKVFLGRNREHIGSKETVQSLCIARKETANRGLIPPTSEELQLTSGAPGRSARFVPCSSDAVRIPYGDG